MTGPAVVALLLQGALLVLGGVAAYRRDVAAAVNTAGVSLLAAVPVSLFVFGDGTVGPALPVWLATAGLLHSVGMLGPYESTWWWDHLTHTVSAALVAALVYAGLVVTLPTAGAGPTSLAAGGAVAGTMAAGVVWELLELVARDVGERLDVDPVLVLYGRTDTALDLLFDLLGALAVVGLDLQVFVSLVERSPGITRTALLAASVAVTVAMVSAVLLSLRSATSDR